MTPTDNSHTRATAIVTAPMSPTTSSYAERLSTRDLRGGVTASLSSNAAESPRGSACDTNTPPGTEALTPRKRLRTDKPTNSSVSSPRWPSPVPVERKPR